MSSNWRELLDRVLDGGQLTEAEARVLAAALADETRRREAGSLFGFEAVLRGCLAEARGAEVALSRERLLATAALREKGQRVRALIARRPWRRWAGAASAAAAVLLLAAAAWLTVAQRYPEPSATGAFHIVESGSAPTRPDTVGRGQRLAVGAGGAELRLGGYCRLLLDADTRLVVRGEARKEAVELEHGRIVSRIQPGRGHFTLLTPLGAIEVKGTEFITTVDYPEPRKGEKDMGRLKKAATVTVMVISGAVAYNLADSVGLLTGGMSQAFARPGEEGPALPDALNGFKGMLIGTIASKGEREFVLKIEKIAAVWKQSTAERPEGALAQKVRIVLGKTRLLEQHAHTLAGMKPGDEVLVEAFHNEGEFLTVVELLRKTDAGGEGEGREKKVIHGEGGDGEGREKKIIRGEGGDGEGHEKKVVRGEGGDGEGREKKIIRGEGEGEHREKKVVRGEGEGEHRDKVRVEGGEGEGREKKPEVRGEGMKEFSGVLHVYPAERRPDGLIAEIKVKEGGEDGRMVEYGVKDTEDGKKLAALGTGRRIRVAGTFERIGEDGPQVFVVKKFRALEGGADEPKPRVKEGDGEGREKKVIRGEGGDGEGREKPRVREGEREGDGERKTEMRREGSVVAGADAVAGFRGMLEGTLVGKGDAVFVLRVEKVTKVWQTNAAKNPEALVGKVVTISLKGEGRPEALLQAFAGLKAGDRVLAGASHHEGNQLVLVEVLRKVEETKGDF